MRPEAKMIALRGFYNSYGLHFIVFEVSRLQRSARIIQRLAEKLCNGEVDQESYEKKQSKQWDNLKEILCGKLSPSDVEVQGDPRGICLKLHLPNKGVTLFPDMFN